VHIDASVPSGHDFQNFTSVEIRLLHLYLF